MSLGRENIVMRKGVFPVLGVIWLVIPWQILASTPPKLHDDDARQLSVEQPRAGVVSGTVVDPSGRVISGAQITLMRPESKSYASTRSDSSGSFRIDAVPAGAYVLTVEAKGFQPLQRDINVTRKPLASLRLALAILTEKQIVTVNGDQAAPVVSSEASANQNANNIDRAALDRLPVFDQDYIATLSRFLDDNIISTNGITLVVNGVEANGPGVTASAIQDVKINQNPYSALFSRPGRARLEIVTKGGTPDFHGTINFMFRDATFDATNKFAT